VLAPVPPLVSGNVPDVILATSKLGTSAATKVLNDGIPPPPFGAARKVFAVCDESVAVSVPEVVIGEPVTEKIEGKESEAEVMVPDVVHDKFPAPSFFKKVLVAALLFGQLYVLVFNVVEPETDNEFKVVTPLDVIFPEVVIERLGARSTVAIVPSSILLELIALSAMVIEFALRVTSPVRLLALLLLPFPVKICPLERIGIVFPLPPPVTTTHVIPSKQ